MVPNGVHNIIEVPLYTVHVARQELCVHVHVQILNTCIRSYFRVVLIHFNYNSCVSSFTCVHNNYIHLDIFLLYAIYLCVLVL